MGIGLRKPRLKNLDRLSIDLEGVLQAKSYDRETVKLSWVEFAGCLNSLGCTLLLIQYKTCSMIGFKPAMIDQIGMIFLQI